MNEQKPALLAQSIPELEDWMVENGEAKYRAKQIFEPMTRSSHATEGQRSLLRTTSRPSSTLPARPEAQKESF